MMSMFDSLMADFDKHDTNTPLYLRYCVSHKTLLYIVKVFRSLKCVKEKELYCKNLIEEKEHSGPSGPLSIVFLLCSLTSNNRNNV